jgi:hypothetical protein
LENVLQSLSISVRALEDEEENDIDDKDNIQPNGASQSRPPLIRESPSALDIISPPLFSGAIASPTIS